MSKNDKTLIKENGRNVAVEPELPRYSPETDVYETTDEFVLLLDLPGVGENDVNVNLEDGILSIVGRVAPADLGDRRLLLKEFEVREFFRSFQLPELIDAESIQAELKNGLLTVTLPKAEEARPRKIDVKIA